jgi:hypothetical protein
LDLSRKEKPAAFYDFINPFFSLRKQSMYSRKHEYVFVYFTPSTDGADLWIFGGVSLGGRAVALAAWLAKDSLRCAGTAPNGCITELANERERLRA